jgi:hypothetical protein
MTEKELFGKVIDGLNSQDWEDTRDHYRYIIDNEDGCLDRRSPLGWIMTDEEHTGFRQYSVPRISASTPRLQGFGRLLFDLEQAWTAKRWRDEYSGYAKERSDQLKAHRRAAIYDVGRLYGLLEAVK